MGRLRCHAIREVAGKWQGIIQGLDMLRSGQIHGQKLLFLWDKLKIVKTADFIYVVRYEAAVYWILSVIIIEFLPSRWVEG